MHVQSIPAKKVVNVYQVAVNTELVNTEPLLPGEIQGYVPANLWLHFRQLINT